MKTKEIPTGSLISLLLKNPYIWNINFNFNPCYMKEKNEEKKVTGNKINFKSFRNWLVNFMIYLFVGIFLIYGSLGVHKVYPEYFKERRKGPVDNMKILAEIIEYGFVSAALIIFIMPIIFNIASYIIAGWKITMFLQLGLYLTLPYWERVCGWRE